MAPAGNFECLHAAIQGGADSVYFGVEKLNMRSHSANNFKMTDLAEIVRICSEYGVKTYLTLNIVLYNEDIEDMKKTLDAAKEAGVTAVIASDMAAIAYARSIGVEVHISTQLSISNAEALRFYAQFADVIVLARELHQLCIYLALHLVRLVVGTLNGRLVQLQLQVVVLSKEILVPQNRLLSLLETLLGDESWNLATKTSRGAYQPFVVLLQLLAVGTRTVVETIGPRLRYDLEQVFVALEILCQEDKVVTTSVGLLGL